MSEMQRVNNKFSFVNLFVRSTTERSSSSLAFTLNAHADVKNTINTYLIAFSVLFFFTKDMREDFHLRDITCKSELKYTSSPDVTLRTAEIIQPSQKRFKHLLYNLERCRPSIENYHPGFPHQFLEVRSDDKSPRFLFQFFKTTTNYLSFSLTFSFLIVFLRYKMTEKTKFYN